MTFQQERNPTGLDISTRRVKIGLDLDGVLIDKPPFVPKRLLEWLVRAHKDRGLAYRFPKSKLEQQIRILSHYYLFRPPIRKSLEFAKSLANTNRYELYIISGRYSFLKDRTKQLLKKHQADSLFKKAIINLGDEQPHLFKEKMIKKLAIDIFVDDDLPLAQYLAKSMPPVKIFCLDQQQRPGFRADVCLIQALEEILDR